MFRALPAARYRPLLCQGTGRCFPRRWKSQLSFDEVRKKVSESKKGMVKLAAIDVDGIPRGKYISKEKFLGSGLSFCSVLFGWDSHDALYDNTTETGWHMGYSDFPATIDLSTFREIPYEDNIPFFLMEFQKPGTKEPLEICPRNLLRSVIKDAKDNFQLTPMVGAEYEFFCFRETPQSLADKQFINPTPITPGMFGYSLQRMNVNREYLALAAETLRKMDVPLEAFHTETGPGVLEAALQFGEALESADRSVLFKMITKDLGRDFGVLPSFMAKPLATLPGCGGHLHESLIDKDGRNVFYDERDPHGMSDIMKSFVAGQLACLPDLMALYAPTVNSYKRLVEGFWAPTTPTWGVENRTVCLRVIPGGPKSTRVEVRIPGADVNPYLAMAASLASGLHGIRNQLRLPPPTNGNAYQPRVTNGNAYEPQTAPRLPRNLCEAAEKLAQSQVAKDLLGDTFVTHFAATRAWEWRQYQKAVTNWEVERYLEIL